MKKIFYIYPLLTALYTIYIGNMPFWVDPGRDLIQAVNNLENPSLLGPPSGIPGLFYGPYWIWLLSVGLLLSKDPRFLIFLLLTIPYFTVFPYLLRRFFPQDHIWIILFFLFAAQYSMYFTELWNVYPAPLLFLILVFLALKKIEYSNKVKNAILFFFTGLVSGFLLNFHLSFGIGVFIGTIAFFVIDVYKKIKKSSDIFFFARLLLFFGAGFLSAFVPMFLFEYRHGFNQFQAIYHTITNAFLYNSAVVGQVGLNKTSIILLYFGRLGEILQIHGETGYSVLFFLIAIIVYKFFKREINLTQDEKRQLFVLICISIAVLFIFLSSKNPVWAYHFIGVEIIMLLLIGLLARKIVTIKNLLILWVSILLILQVTSFVKSFTSNPRTLSSYATKKYIVEKIFEDASFRPFNVFVYSPSIYTYDYDYLFNWFGKDRYRNLPKTDSSANITYLIIPKTTQSAYQDFINYKTPTKTYRTIKKWSIEDGTTVLKRQKI